MSELQKKMEMLADRLFMFDEVVIAFSGGADSTFLLAMAEYVRGNDILAVTIAGPNFAMEELAGAYKFCEKKGIPHLTINLEQEILDAINKNDEERCYHCKNTIFSFIKENIGPIVLEGSNLDDLSDYRPGRKAIKELGVISPLEEIGFTKAEIREGLKALNIPTWNKPALACLASRIPTGEEITKEKLKQIENCEKIMKEMGFTHFRVRYHGELARIEVGQDELRRFCDREVMEKVSQRIKKEGFKYVSLDLEGYQMGSMNK